MGLALASGCGKDKRPDAAVTPPGGHDAGVPDSGEADAASDADVPAREDAGGPIEAGEPEPGLMGACAIDSDKIYTLVERDEPFAGTPLAVDVIHSRFALPFVGDGDCLQAVYLASMVGAANGGMPEQLTAIDACALIRETAAAASGQRWLLASVDNREPPYDVWVQPYDPGGMSAGTGQRITQNSNVEGALAIATLRDGESAMLAWSDESDEDGQALHVCPLDKDGAPRADAVKIEASRSLYYRGLALDALGAGGAALAYWRYSEDFSTSEIVFVALDGGGTPLREEWVLATNAGPNASVNLAIDDDNGGVVYSRAESGSGRQVWFQQIDDSGQAAALRTGTGRAPALRVVNAPARGVDVSLAKLRSSFILAYRALPAGDQTRAQIRLYFLDRYGAIVGGSDVSYTSPSGGRTSVRSSNDGRVVVGWSEVQENGKSATRVVRLPCVGG